MGQPSVRKLTAAEQIALFRAMSAKKKKALPPHISMVERHEDNSTFFISFSEAINLLQQNKIITIINQEHSDYISSVCWTKTNKLMIRLRKPRRDIEPDSRRAARCDIAKIASEIFERCR
jgi:hypothetical protein